MITGFAVKLAQSVLFTVFRHHWEPGLRDLHTSYA